jgi:hypothetical protein
MLTRAQTRPSETQPLLSAFLAVMLIERQNHDAAGRVSFLQDLPDVAESPMKPRRDFETGVEWR